MTTTPSNRQKRGRTRRETVASAALVLLLLVFSFLLGIAFARTLDERPEPGDVVTNVRTLSPLPQQPPARVVTVTITTP